MEEQGPCHRFLDDFLGGQSCGALMTTTTEDCVSLGKDGTLIESTGADACMLTYYPQALK